MSIKDDLEKISKVPEPDPITKVVTPPNPSAFVMGLATTLIGMMLSITFDPLKGINIPGAEDFLRAANVGFTSLTAQPIVKSLSGNLSDDDTGNSFKIDATINVGNIDTKCLFEMSRDYSFSTIDFNSTENKIGLGDIDITTTFNPLKSGAAYYYKLTLTNKNGTVVSSIESIATPVKKRSQVISTPGDAGIHETVLPVIKSWNAELDLENALSLTADVNTKTNYEFIISKDPSFASKDFEKLANFTTSYGNSTIIEISESLDFNSIYYYKLILSNDKGLITSGIRNVITPTKIKGKVT